MGLTAILAGCQANQQAAVDPTTRVAALDGANGLPAINGLNANNGLNVTNGLNANNGLNTNNGLGMVNGLNTNNGFNGNNGFNTNNGFNANNGLNVTNGLNIANGLNTNNGLYTNTGLMTTDAGRMVVKYLAKCALAAGDSLVKQDQNGANYTFPGSIGLAPGYKAGGCAKDCAEMLSSCLMAHVNSAGVHIPIWLDSPDAAVGWGQSPWFPNREGTFFGQIFVTNAVYNLDAYFCNGPGVGQNVVPGRLGSAQGKVPYANAYPVSGGDCDSHCVMNSDGAVSCPANGVTWQHPITTWRGFTFQAEDAVAGSFDSSGTVWTDSGAVPVCGSGVCAVSGTNNGNGQRVQNLATNKGIHFKNVPIAVGGTNNLVLYYSYTDSNSRYFQFKVNGSAPQIMKMPDTDNFNGTPGQAVISLSGFNAGTHNDIYVTADSSHWAPNLDWIEIINDSTAGATTQATAAVACPPHAAWSATASPLDSPGKAIDADPTNGKWNSSRTQAVGDYFQVDFGSTINLNHLNISSGISTSGYPGGFAIYGSTDGAKFASTPFTTGAGTPSATNITFPVQTLRAVKVVITDTSNSNNWTISDIEATCQ